MISLSHHICCRVDGWFGNVTRSVLLPDCCCRHRQQLQTQLLWCLQCNAQLCLSLHIAVLTGLPQVEKIYIGIVQQLGAGTSAPAHLGRTDCSRRSSASRRLNKTSNVHEENNKQLAVIFTLQNEEAGQTNHERLSKGPTFGSRLESLMCPIPVKLHKPSTDVLRTGLKGWRWKVS